MTVAHVAGLFFLITTLAFMLDRYEVNRRRG